MRKIFMLAALALTPGVSVSAENIELNSFGKADVAALEIGSPEVPAPIGDNKIVGGVTAVEGEFPFLVSLQDLAGHFCGGTLIREDWVLTAEHCVADGVLAVVAGMHDLRLTEKTERFQVDRIVPHPGRTSRDYDYALVHLAGKSSYQPLALNRKELKGPVDFVVAGWGDVRESGGMQEYLLQKVTVPMVSADKCSAAYPGKVTDRMICAGYDAGGKDSCQGDSGGPLFMGTGAQKTLVGVVSWGKGCARPNLYGVYAKVNAVTDWIDSVINK